VLAAVVAGLAGWQAWGRGGDRPLAWRDLTSQVGPWQFTHYTGRVYRRREKLVRYLETAWPGRRPELPPIDFAREEAVLTALGPRSREGYELRVVRVTEERRRVEVLLREQTPALGKPQRAGLSYPYRLIVSPRTGKRVVVRIEGRP
jgi:hypothetical protein